MEWYALCYNHNKNIIEKYNILSHSEDEIKKLKKTCGSKQEFSEALQRRMRWRFWSKAEWELIISIKEDRVFLTPWCGCKNPEDVTIDITDDSSFHWNDFAIKYIRYSTDAKISVYDQLEFRWEEFVEYCWSYKHKYQRNKKQ